MGDRDDDRQPVQAVVFDMDGVLLQSEEVWDEVRERLARERGGHWAAEAHHRMMGMSAPEWSSYMAGELGVPMAPAAISAEVVARMADRYRADLPLLPGAVEAVRRVAARWPLGLASSSNRPLIDLVLELTGLAGSFTATVSSEEVARGKPAPDVYLEVARRLGVEPERGVAVEDSANGLRSAAAAGMRVVAIPNPGFPPPPELVRAADVVLDGLDALTTDVVDALARPGGP
ncbi:MAG TPA: HAD family phosphatase [Actinomycetes bacterium]|nr:HAD family phosphatase [Actinomycetes bacterium]